MPSVNLRYKPDSLKPDEFDDLTEVVTRAVAGRLNAHSETSFKDDQIEIFFDQMSPHDITRHELVVTISANRTPAREVAKETIAVEIKEYLVISFPCDCVVKLMLIDQVWRR